MAEKLCMQVNNFISCHLRNSKKWFHLNYRWSHNRKSMILLNMHFLISEIALNCGWKQFQCYWPLQLCHDAPWAVAKEFKVLKNSGLNGTQTMASAILMQCFYQLSYQANWELVIMWVYDNPIDTGYRHFFSGFESSSGLSSLPVK